MSIRWSRVDGPGICYMLDCTHPKIAPNYEYECITRKYAAYRIDMKRIISRHTASDHCESMLLGCTFHLSGVSSKSARIPRNNNGSYSGVMVVVSWTIHRS